MLNYKFWYKVATYGNKNWKGCAYEEELKESANDFLWCWRESVVERKLEYTITVLINNLEEDMECIMDCIYNGYDMRNEINETKKILDSIYNEMERNRVEL